MTDATLPSRRTPTIVTRVPADLLALVRGALGDEAGGLSDAQLNRVALAKFADVDPTEHIRPQYRAYGNRYGVGPRRPRSDRGIKRGPRTPRAWTTPREATA